MDGRGRRIRDNDILVRRADVPRAVAALEAIGYRAAETSNLQAELAVNFQFELARSVAQNAVTIVELHWSPFPPAFCATAESEWWARTEWTDLGTRYVRVFDRTLTIVHLASHFVQHGAAGLWILKDLANAWNAWSEELPPASVIDFAGDMRLRAVLEFALHAAQDRGLLFRPLPPLTSFRAALLRRWVPGSELDRNRPHPDYAREMQMLLLAEPAGVLRWIRLHALPPRSAIAARAGFQRRWRVYMEYPLRPLRVLATIARSRRKQ